MVLPAALQARLKRRGLVVKGIVSIYIHVMSHFNFGLIRFNYFIGKNSL